MLKIKQKFHLSLPHFDFGSSQPVQLSPVANDTDELTRAISDDTQLHDNEWQLDERPNEAQLEQFWDTVEDDIQHDPTWIRFSDDEAV